MKKIVVVLLIFVMVISLFSCGSNQPSFEDRLDLIGDCRDDLLEIYEKLEYSFDYAGGYFYKAYPEEDFYVGFSAMSIYNHQLTPQEFPQANSSGGIICNAIWGTAGNILGIKDTTALEDIEKEFSLEFGGIEDFMGNYDDPNMGDTYSEFDYDGHRYQAMITTTLDGQIKPSDSMLIIINE